jgi:hypothetical protein
MKERPILFNAEMVRAILEGRKSQTRRAVKPQPKMRYRSLGACRLAERLTDGLIDGQRTFDSLPESIPTHPEHGGLIRCPYGVAGDRLWVRETWCYASAKDVKKALYRADWPPHDYGPKWRPSIHMPRWASRITLEVVSVRVERVQDISEEDARAEGCDYDDGKPPEGFDEEDRPIALLEFRNLWDSINAKRGLGWNVNPWVWAVEFKPLEVGS